MNPAPAVARPDVTVRLAVAWVVVPLLLPLLLLGVWEFGVRSGRLPPTLVAPPSAVVADAARMTADGTLPRHAWVSLRRLTAGFVVGSVLAVAAGTLVGLSRAAERVLAPTVGVLAPVPVSAWIPLIIILVGIGEASKVAVIAVGTFFVVFFGTVHGIRSADPKLVEVARVYGKGSATLVTDVLLPSALAPILHAMRAAVGLGWVLLIVAEVIASSDGLGFLMWDARNFSRPDDMIVGMVTVGLLGAATDRGLAAVQRWLLFWRPTFEGQ
ncbi:MAG: ABC transporter permease [Gemmata sp.]